MRNHGWHLPYHPLQIVAVAVFSALAFSFYVFFVPFVGNSVLKFHVIAAFSPLVFSVFILYIRCAAIDPADSGVKAQKTRTATRKLASQADVLLRGSSGDGVALNQGNDEVNRNLQAVHASERSGQAKGRCCFTGLLCPVVTAWRFFPGIGLSRRLFRAGSTEQERSIPEEELLFCSLCEAEILKSSKHCRACDKCVDGFDHHCRWLNNCIGRKNYKIFVAVMIASLLMLVMEWAIGIFVLVRCFTDKRKFDKEIVEKLGSSFTRIPFVVVLTLCTFLAMLATLPLTQLLFFHVILIKKGITTYDYIVAIREQEPQEPVLELQVGGSPLSSPATSVTTAVSGGSSSGALHRAVWCTPPRMFVENQSNMKAEVVLQYATSRRGASPRISMEASEGDPTTNLKDGVIWQPKRRTGLSPWKLARLSAKDAAKAAVRARESSSILRPVKYGPNSVLTETEDSSFDTNAEITNAPGGYKVGWRLDLPMSRDRPGLGNEHRNPLFNASLPAELCSGLHDQHGQEKGSHLILPLRSEARSSFRSRSLHTVASFPLTASFTDSPDNLGSPCLVYGDAQNGSTDNQEKFGLHRATSDGYEASGGESADDTVDHGRRFSHAWSKLKFNQSSIARNGASNTSLNWSSGLEDVMAAHSQQESIASSTCETRSHGSGVEASILNHVNLDWPGIRGSFPTSTDQSNNSSPSHYLSPKRGMSPDIQSAMGNNTNRRLDKTNIKVLRPAFYEPPVTGRSLEPMVGKRGISSAKRLKESLLSYRRGLSSSSYSGGPLLSSSP